MVEIASTIIALVWSKGKTFILSIDDEKADRQKNIINCKESEEFTWLPYEYFHEFLSDKWMQIVYRKFDKRIFFRLVCEPIVNAYAYWKLVEKIDRKECMDMAARLEIFNLDN